MENITEQLDDKEVDDILVVCGKQQRKRKRKLNNLTPEYKQRLKTTAVTTILQWMSTGIPESHMKHLVSLSSRVPQLFGLKTTESLSQSCVGDIAPRQQSTCHLHTTRHMEKEGATADIEIPINAYQNTAGAEFRNSQNVLDQLQDTSTTSQQHAFDEDEDFDAFEGTSVINLAGSSSATSNKPLSFKRILCHWAAFTMQKKSHLTYLLELLKEHRPQIDFDTLPSSGKQLMFIDGRDMPQAYTTTLQSASLNRKKHLLPPVINLDNDGNGRYTHFGLETALAGDSPGVYFRNADLLQYAAIYKTNRNALPLSIQKKIEKLHGGPEIEAAKRLLRGETARLFVNNAISLPHFEVDVSCDGVQFFDNSEQAECIPLCVIVHSVSESSDRSRSKPIILQKRSPIIVGVAHCKDKPDVNCFLSAFIAEIKRLDPNNDDITTIGRQFTASIRCVIADWPMRSYLKRVKGHTGYWSCERCIQRGVACEISSNNKKKTKKKKKTIQFLELDAAPRSDEDFLSYCKSDDCPDEHLNGHHDLSPFLDLNFPMVTGFVVEPMHTFYAGCVGGRLKGLAYNPNEGKLSSSQLKQVDQRLQLFEKCKPLEFERHVRSLSKSAKKYKHHEIRNMLMYIFIPVFSGILQEEHLENILLLQYAMLLIGGFVNEPVSQDNLRESSRVLKMYVQQLKQFNYPIRPTTHFASHLPEDALNYGCGVEALSAFVFENFYRFFRNILASGNLPLEQIRNRLVERSKYLLPTSADGMIINSSMQFEIEIKKLEVKTSGQKILIKFSEWKGIKKMVFSDFVLTNQFPNNVGLLKNGNVVVCSDFIEFPKQSNNFLVVGFLFKTKEHACVKPYLSTKYNTFIVSKLDERIGEWNINNLLCKMYTVPYKLNDYTKMPDITLPNVPNRWFTTPIRHTI